MSAVDDNQTNSNVKQHEEHVLATDIDSACSTAHGPTTLEGDTIHNSKLEKDTMKDLNSAENPSEDVFLEAEGEVVNTIDTDGEDATKSNDTKANAATLTQAPHNATGTNQSTQIASQPYVGDSWWEDEAITGEMHKKQSDLDDQVENGIQLARDQTGGFCEVPEGQPDAKSSSQNMLEQSSSPHQIPQSAITNSSDTPFQECEEIEAKAGLCVELPPQTEIFTSLNEQKPQSERNAMSPTDRTVDNSSFYSQKDDEFDGSSWNASTNSRRATLQNATNGKNNFRRQQIQLPDAPPALGQFNNGSFSVVSQSTNHSAFSNSYSMNPSSTIMSVPTQRIPQQPYAEERSLMPQQPQIEKHVVPPTVMRAAEQMQFSDPYDIQTDAFTLLSVHKQYYPDEDIHRAPMRLWELWVKKCRSQLDPMYVESHYDRRKNSRLEKTATSINFQASRVGSVIGTQAGKVGSQIGAAASSLGQSVSSAATTAQLKYQSIARARQERIAAGPKRGVQENQDHLKDTNTPQEPEFQNPYQEIQYRQPQTNPPTCFAGFKSSLANGLQSCQAYLKSLSEKLQQKYIEFKDKRQSKKEDEQYKLDGLTQQNVQSLNQRQPSTEQDDFTKVYSSQRW